MSSVAAAAKQKADPRDARKDDSMLLQKEMIAGNFKKLANVKESGEKVVYTFVPGNINELLMCFDLAGNYPEINSLQSGMRKKTGPYIMEAERNGHSEDVCTYVKSDIGMMPAMRGISIPAFFILSLNR